MISRVAIGKTNEQHALDFLQRKGLSLIAKNYRCLYGEIDLIMRDREEIVFIEVRSRKNSVFGTALDSINARKVKKIIHSAAHFLQSKNSLYKERSRFDIIAITLSANKPNTEWIKNAFSLEYEL